MSFVKRQANDVDHSLTKASRFYVSYHDFYHIPSCIVTPLMNEM